MLFIPKPWIVRSCLVVTGRPSRNRGGVSQVIFHPQDGQPIPPEQRHPNHPLGRILQLLHGFNGIVQRIAHQCIQIHRIHTGQSPAIGHTGPLDVPVLTHQAFFGKYCI